MAVATNWWSEIWSKGRSPKDKTSHKVTANDQMEAERDQVKPRSEDNEDKDEAADCFRWSRLAPEEMPAKICIREHYN